MNDLCNTGIELFPSKVVDGTLCYEIHLCNDPRHNFRHTKSLPERPCPWCRESRGTVENTERVNELGAMT